MSTSERIDKLVFVPPVQPVSFPEKKWREAVGAAKKDLLSYMSRNVVDLALEWTDWTPSFGGGYTSAGEGGARYLKVGNLCHIIICDVLGTFSSAGTNITISNLPFAEGGHLTQDVVGSGFILDGSSAVVAVGFIATGGSSITLYKHDFSTITDNAGGGQVRMNFFYETD